VPLHMAAMAGHADVSDLLLRSGARLLDASNVRVCGSVLQCVAVCCSVLHCAAVCCGVLRCVAVCCSVLQRVAA